MIKLFRFYIIFSVAGLMPLMALRADEKKEQKKGTIVEIDDLKSMAPADWKSEEVTSKFRTHHFLVPHIADDKADAELTIFFFGTGSGGSADANIKRWKGMFTPPEDKKIDDVSKVENFKVGKVEVTYVDIQGTYKFIDRSNPRAKEELRPDYRMLGVVFESPKGPYFFRLVGPAKTVEHQKKAFEDWVKGFK
jgi:hypothetical protein